MKLNRFIAHTSALCLAVIASSHAVAATKPGERAANRPAAASQPAVDTDKYREQMARMQEMHQKMQAAKTPEERAALMSEHWQVMQGGMAMMGQMPGCMGMHGHGMAVGMPPDRSKGGASWPARHGGMGAEHEAMHHRMDMMEMMMQMMVERQDAAPAAAK